MSALEVAGLLIGLALLAISAAELVLLHKIDVEFRNDHGHSLRDATDRVETMLRATGASGLRLETDTVAIRADLSDQHARADAVDGKEPGEAADAASRSEG